MLITDHKKHRDKFRLVEQIRMAHFYTAIPRMCALRDRAVWMVECPGCLASLRSEQGTASLAPLCGYPHETKCVTTIVTHFA